MPFIKFGNLPGSFGIPSFTSFERIRAGVINVGELIMQGANSRLRSANFNNSGAGWIIRGDGTSYFSSISGLPWKNSTPTYANITVGNGTVVSRYVQIGNTVHWQFMLTFGSTTTIGSSHTISFPVNAAVHFAAEKLDLGLAQLLDDGTARYHGTVRRLNTSTCRVIVFNATATFLKDNNIDATNPHTWTTNDVLSFNITYEAA